MAKSKKTKQKLPSTAQSLVDNMEVLYWFGIELLVHMELMKAIVRRSQKEEK